MRVAALCLLVFAAGCKSGPPTFGDPAPKLQDGTAESAYRDLLKRYSGTAEVYSNFDTHLFTGGTFQTWPFREARVRRMAQFLAMTPAEIEQRLLEERADWEQHYVFDLGTWTQDPKYDDFDTKKSIWRIALVTGRGEVLPTEIKRVQRVDHNLRALYPYMGMFWVHYRVKFPKTLADGTPVVPKGTEEVMLRVASTLGKAELRTAAE